MTKLAELDIPVLDGGWINLTEAADRLGYTRAYIYKKASAGDFETLRRVGGQASYVVNESEVEELLAKRVTNFDPEDADDAADAPELSIDDIMNQI